MGYFEFPGTDAKWMSTLERQQEGLGAVGMRRSPFEQKRHRDSLWMQRQFLIKDAQKKRRGLRGVLLSDQIQRSQRMGLSRVSPPSPIPIPAPRRPVPGMSPLAVIAAGDLEVKKARAMRRRIEKAARVVSLKRNLAKRLAQVPGLTEMALYPRKKIPLPQPTWNWLSTQGLITPGGIITPVGSYIEAGPSSQFGGFGASLPGSPVDPRIYGGTPSFYGSSPSDQAASAAGQASVLSREYSSIEKTVIAKAEDLSSTSTPMQAVHVSIAASEAVQDRNKALAAQKASEDLMMVAAQSNGSSGGVPSTKYRIDTTSTGQSGPSPGAGRLPDNSLLVTPGGTVITEAGHEEGVILSPDDSPPKVVVKTPLPTPLAPKILPKSRGDWWWLLVAAGLGAGFVYSNRRTRRV